MGEVQEGTGDRGSPDSEVPANALEQIDRAVDYHVRGIEELDSKLVELMKLGFLLGAGGFAVARLVVSGSASIHWVSPFVIAVSGLFANGLAVLIFAQGYTGFTSEGHLRYVSGPSVQSLAAKALESGEGAEDFQASLLSDYTKFPEINQELMERKQDARRWGVWSLILAAALYGGSWIWAASGSLNTAGW